jgi:hypothetical protein
MSKISLAFIHQFVRDARSLGNLMSLRPSMNVELHLPGITRPLSRASSTKLSHRKIPPVGAAGFELSEEIAEVQGRDLISCPAGVQVRG